MSGYEKPAIRNILVQDGKGNYINGNLGSSASESAMTIHCKDQPTATLPGKEAQDALMRFANIAHKHTVFHAPENLREQIPSLPDSELSVIRSRFSGGDGMLPAEDAPVTIPTKELGEFSPKALCKAAHEKYAVQSPATGQGKS